MYDLTHCYYNKLEELSREDLSREIKRYPTEASLHASAHNFTSTKKKEMLEEKGIYGKAKQAEYIKHHWKIDYDVYTKRLRDKTMGVNTAKKCLTCRGISKPDDVPGPLIDVPMTREEAYEKLESDLKAVVPPGKPKVVFEHVKKLSKMVNNGSLGYRFPNIGFIKALQEDSTKFETEDAQFQESLPKKLRGLNSPKIIVQPATPYSTKRNNFPTARDTGKTASPSPTLLRSNYKHPSLSELSQELEMSPVESENSPTASELELQLMEERAELDGVTAAGKAVGDQFQYIVKQKVENIKILREQQEEIRLEQNKADVESREMRRERASMNEQILTGQADMETKITGVRTEGLKQQGKISDKVVELVNETGKALEQAKQNMESHGERIYQSTKKVSLTTAKLA